MAVAAADRYARRRSASSAVESTTVVESAAQALGDDEVEHLERVLAGALVVLTAPDDRSQRSDDTIESGWNHCAAQCDLPPTTRPTSTTRHGSGSRIIDPRRLPELIGVGVGAGDRRDERRRPQHAPDAVALQLRGGLVLLVPPLVG